VSRSSRFNHRARGQPPFQRWYDNADISLKFAHIFAGTGSNLTINGTVECDASIMNASEDFGAVGAIAGEFI
jgi:hypothetical protein